MSQNPEKIRKLVVFKEKLESKITELQTELDDLKVTLETVNSILLEKGFKRIEMTKEPSVLESSPAREENVVKPEAVGEHTTSSENVIELKAASGEILAILHVTEDSLRALPAGDKNFNVNTPPFNQFLIERVLAKMQERDNELVRREQLQSDKMLSYNVVREGDIIREIFIKNIDLDRLRELKSSIRWTFEKMYEKMKTQD
ncbi:hypothetical protein MUP01_01980 [Candidatus Bathyarchaeota archaeon]|nr:hypothetical protein [Candidatus Bathyarchaeota archaeon]